MFDPNIVQNDFFRGMEGVSLKLWSMSEISDRVAMLTSREF
jgi:uncharacterized small protein (DUF1192 family)